MRRSQGGLTFRLLEQIQNREMQNSKGGLAFRLLERMQNCVMQNSKGGLAFRLLERMQNRVMRNRQREPGYSEIGADVCNVKQLKEISVEYFLKL